MRKYLSDEHVQVEEGADTQVLGIPNAAEVESDFEFDRGPELNLGQDDDDDDDVESGSSVPKGPTDPSTGTIHIKSDEEVGEAEALLPPRVTRAPPPVPNTSSYSDVSSEPQQGSKAPRAKPPTPTVRRSLPPPPHLSPEAPTPGHSASTIGLDISAKATEIPLSLNHDNDELLPEDVSATKLESMSPSLVLNNQGEVLEESEGDPIDPGFHRPPSRSVSPARDEVLQAVAETEEDPEVIRRRAMAARMAKLGGIQFGGPPPISRLPPVPGPREGAVDTISPEERAEGTGLSEEEEEIARKQRIAAKLAGMGGMRIGMLPPGIGGGFGQSRGRQEGSQEGGDKSLQATSPHASEQHAPPPRRPPPPPTQELDSERESQTTSDDGVKVEAEESEIEEVSYEDAAEEVPPPLPDRSGRASFTAKRRDTQSPTQTVPPPLPSGRPPVPVTAGRRGDLQTNIPTPRKSSVDSTNTLPEHHPSRKDSSGISQSHISFPTSQTQSEYVMVEDPEASETEEAILPPPRPSRAPPPRGAPPPPPPLESRDTLDSVTGQWELPSIPDSSIDFGNTSVDLSLSTWSEDSTSYPAPSETASAQSTSRAPPSQGDTSKNADNLHFSSDELMAIWGKVGVQICEAATTLFEKSKKVVVGDGSYNGFITEVLGQVPNATAPSPPMYGYIIYAQTGSAVLRRVTDILPGDIVALDDCKLKGHKGLQTYNQTVGVGEVLVGVVSEFEAKKSKIRVFQANQHVGQQTVESASYRLEDLKSGNVKVFRVLEA